MALQITSISEVARKGEAPSASYFVLLSEISAASFWIYAIINTFVIGIDAHIARALPEQYAWIWNLKFLMFLGILAALLIVLKRATVAKFLAYVTFYPFILLFWRTPRLLMRLGSWSLALGLANAVISYLHGFRYKTISLFVYLTAFTAVATVKAPSILIISSAIMMFILMCSYYRAVRSIFSANFLFRIYFSAFSKTKGFVAKSIKLDDELKNVPVAHMTPTQLNKWSEQLGNAVLLNRACLFTANKLQLFHSSGFIWVSGSLSVFFLILLTTLSFAALNYSIYNADAIAYEVTSPPSLFTFVFYSFNALVNNFIKEIVPASMVSHALWMIEAICAFGILGLFAAHFITLRTQRYSDQLAATARAIEAEGRIVESFVTEEWKLASIDEAIRELERLKFGLLALLIWLTRNLKQV
jgi:hypothetical protein